MNLGFGAAGMGLAILCAACSGTESTPTPAPPSGDPIGRYEPQTRIDFDFELPARSEGKITTTCDIGATGHIATVMPHTHKRAITFEAELVRPDGSTEPFFRDGGFDGESEITVFDEPVSLEGFTRIRHTCTVNNDLDRPIVWGVGENEMCTLFGYMYPPEAQYIGGVPARTDPAVQPDCISIPIGRFRK